MWLNCFLVIFLSSNYLVYSFQFEDDDIDWDEWDSMESFTLSTDDEDDGDGFKTQVKAGLSDSKPDRDNDNEFLPQVKTGLSDSKPDHDYDDGFPPQVNAGLSFSKPDGDYDDGFPPQLETGLSFSKPDRDYDDEFPLQVNGGLSFSQPDGDYDDAVPPQVKTGLSSSKPYGDFDDAFLPQFKTGLSSSKPYGDFDDAFPPQFKTGLSPSKPDGDYDVFPPQVKTGLSFSKPGTDGFLPKVKAGLSNSKPVRPLVLPGSLRIPASKLYKDLFTPEKGSGPVPPLVKSILLPKMATVKPKKPFSSSSKMVEVRCYLDRLHVRVLKSLFSCPSAWQNLKLGTCAVNKASDTHYHFLYYLKGCGIRRTEDADRVTYTNTLYYRPIATQLIVRELPFTVPIRCRYTKFHRSYAIGFFPNIAGGTLYRGLQTRTGSTLAAMDESWNLLPVGQSFVLGKPMCFEAKGAGRGTRKRLYLNSCFVTSSPSPWSTDKFSVIENYGCLVDSKNSALTKFYTSANKMTVRLCVAAFLFKSMISQTPFKKSMYMHCELEVGPETPTSSAKSCMYNTKTKKWTELYGDSSVCNCCASTCPASPRASGKTMITSESWDLKLGRDPSLPLLTEEPISASSFAGNDFELYWEMDDH